MATASKLRSLTATSSYVALPSIQCGVVSILNRTGADLLLEMTNDSAAGQEVSITDGTSIRINVIANAAEVRFKSATGTTGVYVVFDGHFN